MADGSGEPALVALSRGATSALLPVAGVPPGAYRDVLSQATLTVGADGKANLAMAPLSAAVFIPATSPCLTP